MKTTVTTADSSTISPATENNFLVSVNEIDEQIFQHLTPQYWDWVKLFEEDPHANLHQHPEKILLEQQTAADEDSLPQTAAWQVRIHADSSLQSIATLIPKTINTRFAGTLGVHHTLRGFRLAGNRMCGIHADSSLPEMLNAIEQHLKREKADFLLIEDLDENERLFAELTRGDQQDFRLFSPTKIQARLCIRFPEPPEEYWMSFSSKTRYKTRRLIRLCGDIRVEKITAIDQVAGFLRDAHQVSLKSWQALQLGLRIKNDERELAEFTFLAERGLLRSYVLYREEQPVAFLIGNQFNGIFQYEEVGYDADHAKSSPGQVLLLKALEDLIETDTPAKVDFGGGDAEYKRMYGNEESHSGSFWLMPDTFRTKRILAHLSCSQSVKQFGKSVLTQLGLFRKVRKVFRRGDSQNSSKKTSSAKTSSTKTEGKKS